MVVVRAAMKVVPSVAERAGWLAHGMAVTWAVV